MLRSDCRKDWAVSGALALQGGAHSGFFQQQTCTVWSLTPHQRVLGIIHEGIAAATERHAENGQLCQDRQRVAFNDDMQP